MSLRAVSVQLGVALSANNLVLMMRSPWRSLWRTVSGTSADCGRSSANPCGSAWWVLLYERLEGLLKPSVDVLTLAVGALTLSVTVGKSAQQHATGAAAAQTRGQALKWQGCATCNQSNWCGRTWQRRSGQRECQRHLRSALGVLQNRSVFSIKRYQFSRLGAKRFIISLLS